MWKEMAHFGVGSVFIIDSDKALRAQRQTLTVGNSCTGLPSAYMTTKVERDSKKVSRSGLKNSSLRLINGN